jgi:hypothetical protein
VVENIDTDAFPTKRAAIEDALADMIGGTLVICRGNWKTCPESGRVCGACARVNVRPGMTADDVLGLAAQN